MRTHTGEKPYKCKYCERAYAESGDLTKHLRTHVGENTYMCDQCPMAFKYQAELRQHQSEHYKMQQKLLQEQQQLALEQEQQQKQQQENVSTTIESPLQNETSTFGPKIDNSALTVTTENFFPRKELPVATDLLQQQQNNENMYTSGMQYLPLAIHQLQQQQIEQTQQQLPEKKEDVAGNQQQQQDNLDFKESH